MTEEVRERQVVLDTETTGLDAGKGHRIIEIGCVEMVNRRINPATTCTSTSTPSGRWTRGQPPCTA